MNSHSHSHESAEYKVTLFIMQALQYERDALKVEIQNLQKDKCLRQNKMCCLEEQICQLRAQNCELIKVIESEKNEKN